MSKKLLILITSMLLLTSCKVVDKVVELEYRLGRDMAKTQDLTIEEIARLEYENERRQNRKNPQNQQFNCQCPCPCERTSKKPYTGFGVDINGNMGYSVGPGYVYTPGQGVGPGVSF